MIALATASSIEVVHDGEAEPAPLRARSGGLAQRVRSLPPPRDQRLDARELLAGGAEPILGRLLPDRVAGRLLSGGALAGSRNSRSIWSSAHAGATEQTAMALAKRTTVKERRRRPKGSPLADSTIDAWVTALMGLLEELVGLSLSPHGQSPAGDPDESRQAMGSAPARPNLRDAGARRSGQDNSGPSLEEVRRTLHELAREYEANRKYRYMRLRRLLILAASSPFSAHERRRSERRGPLTSSPTSSGRTAGRPRRTENAPGKAGTTRCTSSRSPSLRGMASRVDPRQQA